MQTTTLAARRRGHLSRRERQQLARAQAFSRRTPKLAPAPTPQKLKRDQLELIDHLVRSDRAAVSSALLAIAGIGAGEASRRTVLERVSEAACWARAEGAISVQRSQQIARLPPKKAAAWLDQAAADARRQLEEADLAGSGADSGEVR